MEKKIVKRMAALLLALLCCSFAQGQTGSNLLPADAMSLGSTNVNKVLQWVDPTELELYGFKKTDDFSAIKVGKPIYQTAFKAASFVGGKMETEVLTVLMPVWLNGTVRCFLYISPDGSRQWQVVGIGGANEARIWGKQIKYADDDASVDRMTMIHVTQTASDYFLVSQDGIERYVDVSVWKDHSSPTQSTLDNLYQEAVQTAAQLRATTKEDTN